MAKIPLKEGDIIKKTHTTEDELVKYAKDHSLRLIPAQEKLIERTLELPDCIMLASADEQQLLANICRAIKAKKALDIGVYTGYSALTIALALQDGGKVIGCDVNKEVTDIGRPFFEEAGVADKIDIRIAPASETLQKLLDEGEAGTFDYAFIDADKTGYDDYYEACLQLVRSGGLIAVDNVLRFGRVLNPDKNDAGTMAICALNDKLLKDERIDISFLAIADGVTLAFKR